MQSSNNRAKVVAGKLWRHGYKIGSAATFAVPLVLNFLISAELSISVAAHWLTAIAFAALVRSMLNSKAMDVVLRFGSYVGSEKLTAVLHWALVLELIFSSVQTGLFLILIRLTAPELSEEILLFSIGFMLLTNLRDILYAYTRQRFSQSLYFQTLWLDAVMRLGMLGLLSLKFDLFWPHVIWLVLGPMLLYPVALFFAVFSGGRALEKPDIYEIFQFSLIAQGGSLLKASYQNIDVLLAPVFLSDTALWTFLTARQMFMQALSMSVMPIITATIPTLVDKFKSSAAEAFWYWLVAARRRILKTCLVNLAILWSGGVFWMELIEIDRLTYLKFFIVVSTLGVIRTNLWWNRDCTYFFDRFFQIKQSFVAGLVVSIVVGLGFLFESFWIILVGHTLIFGYLTLVSNRFVRQALVISPQNIGVQK